MDVKLLDFFCIKPSWNSNFPLFSDLVIQFLFYPYELLGCWSTISWGGSFENKRDSKINVRMIWVLKTPVIIYGLDLLQLVKTWTFILCIKFIHGILRNWSLGFPETRGLIFCFYLMHIIVKMKTWDFKKLYFPTILFT